MRRKASNAYLRDLDQRAQELAESYLNGNASHVAEEVIRCGSKARAAALAGRITMVLLEEFHASPIGFLRALERRASGEA